jgi:hypothetical protein
MPLPSDDTTPPVTKMNLVAEVGDKVVVPLQITIIQSIENFIPQRRDSIGNFQCFEK